MSGVLAAIGIDPNQLIASVGTLGLFFVVFAESGILLGFFLPGDSLLFTAGLLSATTDLVWPFWALLIGCSVAAVAGDQVGYMFGERVGPRLFTRPDSRLFRREHLLRAERFFDEHGSKTILLARFVPIVRTFTPVVAGGSKMHYRTFATFNVIGGTLWAVLMLTLGYVLGRQFPSIGDYLDVAVAVIIVLSVVPIAVEYLRRRQRPRDRVAASPHGEGACDGDVPGQEVM
jgi:membrane-associated protein